MSNNINYEIESYLSSYAKNNGLILNPNKKQRDILINGLSKKKEKYKFLYCPCKILSGNEDKDKDLICPCKDHIAEIEMNGMCHCMLFFKKDIRI